MDPIKSEIAAGHWPLERALFAVAGSAVLISTLLALLVSRWFALLAALVGVSQWLYVLTGRCPASVVLRRRLGLEPALCVSWRPADAAGRQPTVSV